MSMFKSFLLGSAFAVLAAGCSNNGGTPTDGGATGSDATSSDSTTPPITKLECTGNNCTDFVVNNIILPSTPTEAQKYSVDLDGNGTKDYAFGNILGALSSSVQNLPLADAVAGAVNAGATIQLFRVQSDSLTDSKKAYIQSWIGKAETCCADPKKLAECKTEAADKCFKGDHSFTPDPTSATDAILGGAITAGDAMFGPGTLRVKLSITDVGVLNVTLKAARVWGKVTATGITDGALVGAIPKSELDNNVIPTVAQMLDNTLKDSATEQSTKDLIISLFDTNKDSSVTKDEVANSEIIKTFLAGDVDVDGDKEMELSFGIGYSAVGAKIVTN